MLSFASAIGNLFNIIGKLGLAIKQMASYQASQKTNLTDTTGGIVAQLNNESDLQGIIGTSYIGILNGAGSVGSVMQNVARQVLNRKIFRDNPRIAQNLQSLQIGTSIQELIRQMKLAGASVLSMTIGATPTSFTGTGNGVIVASVKRPLDGLVLENSFAETLLFTVTADSYTGGATAGSETLTLTGTGQETNPFAFEWPLGSNARVNLTSINGNVDNSRGNVLTNSGFDKFTSNVPNKWTLAVGVAGTNIAQESTLLYDGVSAVRFIGDGVTLTQIKQQFNNTAGTLGALKPLTQYGFCVFMRRDGVAVGSGTLVIDLVDQNNIVIQDANGVNNSFSIDLTTLTTSYASFTGVFRTPTILPTSQFLRIRQSVALTNGRTVFMDKASMGVMTQSYKSGPFFSWHSGSVNAVLNDYATVPVTNSRGAGGTLSTFQTLIFQLYYPDILSSEFLIPSSGSPNVSDGLIS